MKTTELTVDEVVAAMRAFGARAREAHQVGNHAFSEEEELKMRQAWADLLASLTRPAKPSKAKAQGKRPTT